MQETWEKKMFRAVKFLLFKPQKLKGCSAGSANFSFFFLFFFIKRMRVMYRF